MIKFPSGNFHSKDCAIEYARKKAQRKIIAQKNKQVKQQKSQARKDKFKAKSYASKLSELQGVFNELRRYEEFLWFHDRGIEPYCISCLKPLGNDQWCCGHFKTVGARGDLRFDKKNTYLQHNVRCNKHLSGDVENYKKGLAYRFGEEEAKEIINYTNKRQDVVKLTDEEIQKLKKEWRAKVREIRNILGERQ